VDAGKPGEMHGRFRSARACRAARAIAGGRCASAAL
jgi:hypothetical protein